MDPRSRIPSVDRLLAHPRLAPRLESWSRRAALAAVRRELERLRAELEGGGEVPGEDEIAARCAAALDDLATPRPRRVINATGVIVHTNLGRAPLGARALSWLAEAAGGYSNLEYDLAQGSRGHRHDHVQDLLELMFPGSAALVVNNNAAAVLLVLNTLALGREVLVSRGELIEIGGSFRIPEILERSGARLREVGTTNRTHARDFEQALGPETGLILRVWPSNYRIVGFTTAVALPELVAIGRRAGLPVVADQGCGRLFRDGPGPPSEPAVEELLEQGTDLVCFSGDKMLGGPQAGLIVGRAELVRRCAKNPLARALRPDKIALAAVAATCLSWLRPDPRAEIPAARMLAATADELRAEARRLAAAVRRLAPGLDVAVREDVSRVGGGAAPEEDLPTWVVELRAGGIGDDELLVRLRTGHPPVVARARDGAVVLDPRTLLPGEHREVASAIASALAPDKMS
ncbi:MAG: L-seryl-tRNA(Sec) selenium transferase [Acidobacteria bacterium]|nr:L-seryl-tRNA(Sec) selenium transferase [Acidobacteriota bacterium]